MSLHPTVSGEVPTSTATVARAAFPQGNPYLLLRDRLGTIFTDAQFAPLFAHRGQPAECPWRLALVTLLQFAKNLSDRRAADAIRSRIDWKYLLSLELTDPGFDASVLSEFRGRLVARSAEEHLLDTLLTLCRDLKLLNTRGRQRTDSTHVLGAVRSLNRLECVTETLRAALNALATAAPDWLRAEADPACWSDMIGGLAITRCRTARQSGVLMPSRSVAMVISCLRPSWLLMRRYGCDRSRRLSCCGRPGSRISASWAMSRPPDLRLLPWCDGGRIRRGFPPRC